MARTPRSVSRLFGRFYGNAAGTAGGYAVGSAMSPTLEPLTQALANETWSRFPNRPLSPDAEAEAVARGLQGEADGEEQAALSGIAGWRFKRLAELGGQPPSLGNLLELLRRGDLSEADVQTALHDQGIRERYRGVLLKLREYLVPPSDLVRMGVREVFNPRLRAELDLDAEYPDAITEPGAHVGISESNMRNYWAAHWELPSYTQGLEMLFRGEITRAQFQDLLKALDYAPVWRDKLEKIGRAIPGVQDFIRFAVREVFNPAQRRALQLDEDYPAELTAKAALHGLSEQDARDFWAAHWQLPSPTQGYQMLFRGEITADELDGLLKALDYSPKWRDKLANIAHRVPTRVDLRRMLNAGVIDRAQVKAGYIRLGYTAADAETLTRFAEALKVGGTAGKNLTVAQLRAEFEAGFMPEPAFRDAMATLGFDAAETQALVHLGDYARVKRTRDAIVANAHKGFVNRGMDESRARELLTAAGMHADAQGAELAGWELERESLTAELTDAQIVKAFKKGLLTEADAIAELTSRGLTDGDARIRLQL